MQQKIDRGRRNGEVISPVVKLWVQEVDMIIEGLPRFLEEASRIAKNGWSPNLKSRYSMSRKAKKMTQAIVKLLQKKFDSVSHSAAPQGFKDFQSRIKLTIRVLEALRDDMINMIAICGMGAIGKTTMAKEVAKRAKDDKLFDEVVMAMVSQNQDLRKIQGQIVEMLGLKLVEENSLVREERLKKRKE